MGNRIMQLCDDDYVGIRYVFKILSSVFDVEYEDLRKGVLKTRGSVMRFFLKHPTKENYSLSYDMEDDTIEESYIVRTYEMGEYSFECLKTNYKVLVSKDSVAYVISNNECLSYLDGELKLRSIK